MQRRRRGSVRPEQPERTVTMSFSIGPIESQRQNRAPSSRHTATDSERRQLRPSAAGCPGEREGLWHRRTLFWRTSSGVQVVSRSEACFLGVGWGFGLTGWRLGPGLCWNTVCFCVSATTEVWWRINTQSLYTRVYFCTDGVHHLFKTARGFMAQSITLSNVKPIEVSCPGDCFQREKRASQF